MIHDHDGQVKEAVAHARIFPINQTHRAVIEEIAPDHIVVAQTERDWFAPEGSADIVHMVEQDIEVAREGNAKAMSGLNIPQRGVKRGIPGDYPHLVGGSGQGSGCRCTLEVLQQAKDSGGGAMDKIQDREGIANLPVAELEGALEEFLAPVADQLPDVRLRRVLGQAVQGIVGGQSPVVTELSRTVARSQECVWPVAKRVYRFLANRRFGHQALERGLYAIAQETVERADPAYLVVALDPVNFEKPYTEKLEGVSTVLKSTPPGPNGKKRLTPGYPALTATIVNLDVPVIAYARWFSYQTKDFLSENRELWRAIEQTGRRFPRRRLRFVADSGLDDQKLFGRVRRAKAEFIIRASHLNRIVEVFNDRRGQWESGPLESLVATVPRGLRVRVAFQHARRERAVTIEIGWLQFRLPGQTWPAWALIAHDPALDRALVLLTNVPIRSAADAHTIYTDWRDRPRIEHTYRFDQEDGLDVEDMRVQKLERMRRLFILVLLATLFIYHLGVVWPRDTVRWLRCLGGKLGLRIDRDGPYVLLAGIRAVFVTVATLAFAAHHPFPAGHT